MAVNLPDQDPINTYTGNGTEDNYDFTFWLEEEEDLTVKVAGVTKTRGTHYNIDPGSTGDTAGGSITFTGGNIPANGAAIILQRDTVLERDSVFTVGAKIGSPTYEADQTRTMAIFQEQRRDTVLYLADLDASVAAAQLAETNAETAETNAEAAAVTAVAAAEGVVQLATPADNTVSTAKIQNDAVTLAKIATLTANRLVGTDGSGNPTEVSLSGASLSAGVLTITEPTSLFGAYRSGRYFLGIGNDYNFTGAAMTANRLYYHPFFVRATTTFDRISIYVKTSGGTNARLGIYNMVGGVPTTLVSDCGTVSTASTGSKEITISQSLTAGQYALCAVFDGTPTIVTLTTADLTFFYEQLGTKTDVSGGSGYGGYKTHTYGALPSPFGTVTSDGHESTVPLLGMRAV